MTTVSTNDASAGDASTASLWTYQYTGDELAAVCPPDETASDSAAASCAQYTYQTGTDYPAAVLDAGPYSYWRLDQPSGSTVAASRCCPTRRPRRGVQQFRRHPRLVLRSRPAAGGSTDAASLSGSSSYVQLPGNLVASSSYQSIALWFKTSSSGVLFSYSDAALSAGTVNNNYTPSLYVGTDGKLNGEFWYSGGCTPITSTAAVNDGKWHFVVLTSPARPSRSTWTACCRAACRARSPRSRTAPSTSTSGRDSGASTGPTRPDPQGFTRVADSLDGQVAEAAFFTSPLPATQITQLYDDAQQSSAWMTKDVTAAGSTAAQVAYNAADGRVSSVTDQDGGTWTLGRRPPPAPPRPSPPRCSATPPTGTGGWATRPGRRSRPTRSPAAPAPTTTSPWAAPARSAPPALPPLPWRRRLHRRDALGRVRQQHHFRHCGDDRPVVQDHPHRPGPRLPQRHRGCHRRQHSRGLHPAVVHRLRRQAHRRSQHRGLRRVFHRR